VQVTGRVIARTVVGGQRLPQAHDQGKQPVVKKCPLIEGLSSSGGEKGTETLKAKGKPTTPNEQKVEEDNQDDDEEEVEPEDDHAALEALEK